MLPKCFHSAVVLELCHDHPTSGHFGEARTWDCLSANYFWPDAKTDIVNWIKSCNICNQFNPPPKGYAKLIIVDHFSKWREFIPVSDTSAPTITQAIFDLWCCQYSIMDCLHSDARQMFTDK